MRSETAQPCIGPPCSVRRIRRSRVPCNKSMRDERFMLLDVYNKAAAYSVVVECQQQIRATMSIGQLFGRRASLGWVNEWRRKQPKGRRWPAGYGSKMIKNASESPNTLSWWRRLDSEFYRVLTTGKL